MKDLIFNLLKDEKVVKDFYKNNSKISCSDINNEALVISTSFLTYHKTIFIVKNSLFAAQKLYDRISSIIGNEEVFLYPCDESFRLESLAASKELVAERVFVINKILEQKPIIVIAHLASLIKYLPKKEIFEQSFISLKVNNIIKKEELINKLVIGGYERVAHIDHTLQFSSRGGVVDVFSCNLDNPLRIEFFDDEIDSLRLFDLQSQRTIKHLNEVKLLPASELVVSQELLDSKVEELNAKLELLKKENFELKEEIIDKLSLELNSLSLRSNSSTLYKYFHFINEGRVDSIANYLPKDSLFLLSNKDSILENYKLQMLEEIDYKEEIYNSNAKIINYNLSLDFNNLIASFNFKNILEFDDGSCLSLISKDVTSSNGNSLYFKNIIDDYLSNNYKLVFCIDNPLHNDYLKNVLEDYEINYLSDKNKKIEKINIFFKNIKEGFELPNSKIVFISASEIFGSYSPSKNTSKRFKNSIAIKNIDELKVGDFVVHETNGIGKYAGIVTLELNGIHRDYIHLIYKNDVKIYTPLEQFHLVRKYVSSDGVVPKLSDTSTNSWEKTKKRIKSRVNDIADKLIEVYSSRVEKEGFAFEFDDELMNPFFASFPYELTTDQKKAYLDIKKDMESPYPMDRLLCGDVGFGKTEVAFRAAYGAILNNKQVAMLCPTTLLSRQHYKVAIERFQNFGVRIALVNRFVSLKDQKKIQEDLSEGKIDLIIGTHRLLSPFFTYKDLGLLIIDEEHRFGVEHKEKIKNYKMDIDVLTLSATPIPRTLQMSLVGIRNLSQIESAPLNRMPVQTYVMYRNPKLIKEIIERELGRDGQVFYLLNDTQKVSSLASKIQSEIKGANVVYIHGKMDKHLIEDTMLKFYNHEANVLVCTTIIENGIDIPSANTVIIENADHFGLSQLYQIKGRVGRSDRLGYAYLLYDPNKELTETSKKRLKTIKEFTQLGSGYRIAMRDLSIRGAGDILGAEQSGFIDNVGIDLYLQILKEAIDEKQNGKVETKKIKNSNINFDAYIPQSYEENDMEKINLYKKIQGCNTLNELKELNNELLDLYGKMPNNVKLLLEKRNLEVLSDLTKVENIEDNQKYIDVYLSKDVSSIDGIGIVLFELTYKLSRDFFLDFKDKKIKIRLYKKSENWLNLMLSLLEMLQNKVNL